MHPDGYPLRNFRVAALQCQAFDASALNADVRRITEYL